MNWALEGLARLEQRGRFLVPQRVLNGIDEYRRHNNPVQSWVEEKAEVDPIKGMNDGFWEPAGVLYGSYENWTKKNGHRPLASNKFGIELRRINGVEVKPHPDSRQRGYEGIRLLNPNDQWENGEES